MKKVLVTGGAGFIGTNLIRRLLSQGYQVVSIDNYSTGLHSNEIKSENVTYLDYELPTIHLTTIMDNHDFDVVFHLAAIARIQPSFENPLGYFHNNATTTLFLAKECADRNIPIIYSGSSSHHSGKFKNPYTFSKSIGEEGLELFKQHYNLKYTIARFYNVYGPNQLTEGGYTTLIGRWLNRIEQNLPLEIYGTGEKRRDFTHVDDIIDGLIKIYEQNSWGHIYELGRGQNYSVNEVAEMFNGKYQIEYKEDKPGEAHETLCDSSLAHEKLGWNPTKNLTDYINGIL